MSRRKGYKGCCWSCSGKWKGSGNERVSIADRRRLGRVRRFSKRVDADA